MRLIWLTLAALCLAAPVRAESIAAPEVRANDSWSYQHTVQTRAGWNQTRVQIVVDHVSSSSIAISTKQVGSTMPPGQQLTGTDWSRTRNVNGRQTVVNQPFAFPLAVGKSWTVDYTEANPNRAHSSEHLHHLYKVVGWEDVTVSAGNFHALKIESEGEWQAMLAPAVSAASGSRVDAQGTTTVVQTNRTTPQLASGRTYKAFWYVPSVKRWVKSVEEYYGSDGQRTEQYEDELLSMQLAN